MFIKVIPLILLIFMSSCASIVSDSDYIVNIRSEPQGANFIIKDRNNIEVERGKTPANIILESGDGYFKKSKYNIKYSKTGYSDQHKQLNAKLDPWYYGNIVIGGLIGFLIIDPVTGSMFKLPKSIDANLSEIPEK